MKQEDHIRGLLADGFSDAEEIAEIVGTTSQRVKKLMAQNARRRERQKLEDHRRYLLAKKAG